MKKRVLSVLLILMLVLGLSVGVSADTEYANVLDDAGLLSESQWDKLQGIAADLTREYQYGVYLITLQDYRQWGESPQEAAENLYTLCDLGIGESREGLMLMLSMEERDFWMLSHGNVPLTDENREKMQEYFLDDFGEDDWYGGFRDYLRQCDLYLKAVSKGDPDDYTHGGDSLLAFLIAFLISATIAAVVCMAMKSQMNTAVKKTEAAAYVVAGSTDFTSRVDRFTHTTTVRTKIESDKSSSGSGGSRSSSGGGGGFSGGGGKF